MEHHFNVQLATKYGVNEATFCHNLYFWIKKNQANKKHFYDGHYWTYNSMEAFTELFPYWTFKQIRTIISNCEKKGLIIKGNYNLEGYDRTTWYALTDVVFEIYEGKPLDVSHLPKRANESLQELPKRANASAQKGKPIPDSKPDNKQRNKNLVNKRAVNNTEKPIESISINSSNQTDDSDIENTIAALTNEYRLKGLNKEVCVQVVNEALANKRYIHNFGGYLRTMLETTLYRVKVKTGEIDPSERFNDSEIPFFNWLEE